MNDENAVARVMPYGSYRLGTPILGTSDIDVLVLAPFSSSAVTAFRAFLLKQFVAHCGVRRAAIIDASVPLLSFQYIHEDVGMFVDIDIVIASIPSAYMDVDLIDYLNVASILATHANALNGYRGTELLLRSVPEVARSSFSPACRAIKLWAIQRGIYGPKFGYFSGTALALMTLYICQLYPSPSVHEIIATFFGVFSQRSLHEWTFQTLSLPNGSSEGPPCRRRPSWTAKPMNICSITYPHFNVASRVSASAVCHIHARLQEAYHHQLRCFASFEAFKLTMHNFAFNARFVVGFAFTLARRGRPKSPQPVGSSCPFALDSLIDDELHLLSDMTAAICPQLFDCLAASDVLYYVVPDIPVVSIEAHGMSCWRNLSLCRVCDCINPRAPQKTSASSSSLNQRRIQATPPTVVPIYNAFTKTFKTAYLFALLSGPYKQITSHLTAFNQGSITSYKRYFIDHIKSRNLHSLDFDCQMFSVSPQKLPSQVFKNVKFH